MIRALVAAALLATTGAAAADLEDALAERWRGMWVLTRVDTFSGCDSAYTNNEAEHGRVAPRSGRRFTAGELARVDKVNVTRGRVDLYLGVAEPVLQPVEDGPFTLFEERTCRVQLMVELPRGLLKGGDPVAVSARLEELVERHADERAATASEAWNRRAREPLPPDYERTLARHAAWKVEQANARFAELEAEAVEETTRALDRVSDEPAYLAGLAAGVEALRTWRPYDCPTLARASFAAEERPVPAARQGDSSEARAWRRGFADGQRLAYHLAVLRRVRPCFLSMPPVPE